MKGPPPKMAPPRDSGKDGPKSRPPQYKGDGVSNRLARRKAKADERRQRALGRKSEKTHQHAGEGTAPTPQ